MAPTRKKSVNKRFLNEVSPDKEVKKSNKNKQQAAGKKKLSDKLGPQWSKGELKRFYKAYRAHGKDWMAVVAEVRNRSLEMVEALYNMNRAYLSLPEGTASVIGLIAMMTDYYSVLEASESERESDEILGTVQKLQKRKRAKVQPSASKEDLHHPRSVTSTDGCLSLLKRARIDGGQPRVVGKRTPRVPVSYLSKKDDRGGYFSPKNINQNVGIYANDDEVAHVAALALTEALQKGGSPQVCRTPRKRTQHTKSSPVKSWDRMSQTNLHDATIHWEEDGIGYKKPDGGVYAKGISSLVEMEGVGTVEVHRKGKKFYGKKVKVQEIGNSISDDGGEACSGTEGQKANALKGKVDIEVTNAKTGEKPPWGQRKRGKKLASADEVSALDALHTLADVFVMDSELRDQLNEDRTMHDADEKSGIPEATSSSHNRDEMEVVRRGGKVQNPTSGAEGSTPRKPKLGKYSARDFESLSEAKQRSLSINNKLKRKRQSSASISSNAEAPVESHLNKPSESESLDEEDDMSAVRSKHTSQVSAPSKQFKSIGVSEGPCVSGDPKSPSSHQPVSTSQAAAATQVILPTSKRSRRKMYLKQAFVPKEGKLSENMLKNQANKYAIPLSDGALHLKEKLSGCLSSSLLRRWCTFEWFYSAIDYPWFAKREFVEYLNHVGLGHIPRLTRVEWGVIRSSLGKPRRFSERFLHEEREKLNQYRESVRKHYTELRTGVREGLPTDLARPLSVGQRVIAIHPKTRELYGGSVLTVDHDKCRVQFDRPEIGVEFTKDIDCMPLNPWDNMPETLRRHGISKMSKEMQVNGYPNVRVSSIEHLQNARNPPNSSTRQPQVDTNYVIPHVKTSAMDVLNTPQVASCQPSAVAQIQTSELNHSLDNKTASPASLDLRQHHTHPGDTLPPWMKPPLHSIFTGGLPSSRDRSFLPQESESAVVEIVKGSRLKAHRMVDVAVQAISSLKDGEDAFVRIGEALDSMEKRQPASESRILGIKLTEQINGGLGHHNQTSEPQGGNNVSGSGSGSGSGSRSGDSDKVEAAIPSELISSCVAALLMIQTCTERQYPPADVAQIIDSAVSSLQPCCPQNLPIYREIQMCMGRIKTQILALIPTWT